MSNLLVPAVFDACQSVSPVATAPAPFLAQSVTLRAVVVGERVPVSGLVSDSFDQTLLSSVLSLAVESQGRLTDTHTVEIPDRLGQHSTGLGNLNRRGFLSLTCGVESVHASLERLDGTQPLGGQSLWARETVNTTCNIALSRLPVVSRVLDWQPGWQEWT